MIILIILGIIVLLLLLLLLLPLTIDLAFDNNFMLKVKYSGITVYDNTKKRKPKVAKKHNEKAALKKSDGSNKKKDNFIMSTYKQKGLLGAIKYFCGILQIVLKKLWWIVKRLKFRKFKLDLKVATPDAAQTAIHYGKICAAVYPVLSLLQTNADFKPSEINVSADFENQKSEFAVAINVTTRLFFCLVAVFSALIQFLKLQRKEREKYERTKS